MTLFILNYRFLQQLLYVLSYVPYVPYLHRQALVCSLKLQGALGELVVGAVRRINLRHARLEGHIRAHAERASLGLGVLGHGLAGRHAALASGSLAGREQGVAVSSVARLRDERRVLVEDLLPSGLDAGKLAWDVLVEDGDDGDLGDVLDGVGLGVPVGNVGVLVVVVPPGFISKDGISWRKGKGGGKYQLSESESVGTG